MYLEKLTFNSRLDSSRKHIVHGECTRSTNSVSSKLVHWASMAVMVCRALCRLEERVKAYHKAWACPNPLAA